MVRLGTRSSQQDHGPGGKVGWKRLCERVSKYVRQESEASSKRFRSQLCQCGWFRADKNFFTGNQHVVT